MVTRMIDLVLRFIFVGGFLAWLRYPGGIMERGGGWGWGGKA